MIKVNEVVEVRRGLYRLLKILKPQRNEFSREPEKVAGSVELLFYFLKISSIAAISLAPSSEVGAARKGASIYF